MPACQIAMKPPVFFPALAGILTLICTAQLTAAPQDPPANPAATPAALAPYRKLSGGFTDSKEGYIILTTSEIASYSQELANFAKHKESLGFRVYIATEKEYGTVTGVESVKVTLKRGTESYNTPKQAIQLRRWLGKLQPALHLKYGLFIGDQSGGSPTFPYFKNPGAFDYQAHIATTDEPYADLIGAVEGLPGVDYMEAVFVERKPVAPKGVVVKRTSANTFFMGRIACAGQAGVNSIWDLDFILRKIMRYEEETRSGKTDWRARSFYHLTNYGSPDWDVAAQNAYRDEGGGIESASRLSGGGRVPEFYPCGGLLKSYWWDPIGFGLIRQTSHAGPSLQEGIGWSGQMVADRDDRRPAVFSIVGCDIFGPSNFNMGQADLRRGGIFGTGLPRSGYMKGAQFFAAALPKDRQPVGVLARKYIGGQFVGFGDPSVRIYPEAGQPLTQLRITPAPLSHYEERTLTPGRSLKPVVVNYTLSNQTNLPMSVRIESPESWLALDPGTATLPPGATCTVKATTNASAGNLGSGMHSGVVRFHYGGNVNDEQVADRHIVLNLLPPEMCYCKSFDAGSVVKNKEGVLESVDGIALVSRWKTHEGKQRSAKNALIDWDANGKSGGALRVTGEQVKASLPLLCWRGFTASFWFKADSLPVETVAKPGKGTAAKPTPEALLFSISTARLMLDARGEIFLHDQSGDKARPFAPLAVGKVDPGSWHRCQIRSRVDARQTHIQIDSEPWTTHDLDPRMVKAVLSFGGTNGLIDEPRVWSCELDDNELTAAMEDAVEARKPAKGKTAPVKPPPPRFPGEKVFADANDALDFAKLPPQGVDISGARFSLLFAPDFLEMSPAGRLSIRKGADFELIDPGGYNTILQVEHASGLIEESPFKIRIPVPVTGFKMSEKDGIVTITHGPMARGSIRFTTDGTTPGLSSPVYHEPIARRKDGTCVQARFFLYEEYPMAVATSASVGVVRTGWKVHETSGGDKTAALAFDGRGDTQWVADATTFPQSFSWNMGEPTLIDHIACSVPSYKVRTDRMHAHMEQKGQIKDYEIHASDYGTEWGEPVLKGTLPERVGAKHVFQLERPITARYVKIVVKSVWTGKATQLGELEVFSK